MKKLYFILIGLLAVSILTTQCQDPLEDIQINVSTDIIEFSTLLEVQDGNGNPVSNVTVEIAGADASAIYNLAGKKEFSLDEGVIGLGVHPDFEPTASSSVEFNVILSGSGIVTQVVPITIVEGQTYSVKTVTVLSENSLPVGVSFETPQVTLTENQTAGETTLSTTNDNQSNNRVDVKLPDGTSFQDESGNTLTGSTLTSVLVNLDPSKESALSVFPGGSLTTNNVIAEGQTNASAGTFVPAAVINFELRLGNTQVRNFSKPITLAMQLDPDYINVNTGSRLQAGETLGVYSYHVGTAQWKFEKNVVVENIGGRMIANFETDHLTWYMVGAYVSACPSPVALNLDAPWMEDGMTYPLKVEALLGGKVINSIQVSATSQNKTVRLSNLPLSTSGVSIRVSTLDGQFLTPIAGVSLPGNSCNTTHNITISQPAATAPKVTLQLYVRCPGNSDVINVLPTFYLYYREAAPSSDKSGYKFLGVVTNGFLSTNLLTVGSVEYDFKAVWGDQVKVVNRKTVSADNSATVGVAPGDIIGEKAGAINLQMLNENCN